MSSHELLNQLLDLIGSTANGDAAMFATMMYM